MDSDLKRFGLELDSKTRSPNLAPLPLGGLGFRV